MPGRPALVRPEAILDASLRLLAGRELSSFTTRLVCTELGISNGSLFHAFDGREALLGALWLRTVSRFQDGFLAVLASGAPRRAVPTAAAWVLAFAREQPHAAALLARYRSRDFHPDVAGTRRLARRLERGVHAAAARLAPNDVERARRSITFAAIQVPYGVVKSAIASGRALDAYDEELVRRAARAVVLAASK